MNEISYRKFEGCDITELQVLHEDWFPIRYNQAFYDNAVQGKWLENGDPLFTQVAIETIGPEEPNTMTSPEHTIAAPQLLRPDATGSVEKRDTRIVGAVTAQIIGVNAAEDKGLLDSYGDYTKVMYILTLGTHSGCRRRGIASQLLKACVAEARKVPDCGAVYLHVKSDNESGKQFYERNGFTNIRYLKDYYTIDNENHHAYVYIQYVNDATPPSGWLDYIRGYVKLQSMTKSADRHSPIMAIVSSIQRLLFSTQEESTYNISQNENEQVTIHVI